MDYVYKNYHVKDDPDEHLRLLKAHDKIAVAISRLTAANDQHNSKSDIFCFEESQNIYSYLISLYIRKGHPDSQMITTLTKMAFESGLFVKWKSMAQVPTKREVEDLSLFSLKLEHISASIFIYVSTIILAIGLFVAECVVHWQVNQPNPKRHWVFFNFLMVGQRMYFRNLRAWMFK